MYVCMYVCIYVVSTPCTTKWSRPGFPPTPLFELSQYVCPYTGLTTYSMGTGTNPEGPNRLHSIGSFHGNQRLKGARRRVLNWERGGGDLDLILGSGMGNYIFRLLGVANLFFTPLSINEC